MLEIQSQECRLGMNIQKQILITMAEKESIIQLSVKFSSICSYDPHIQNRRYLWPVRQYSIFAIYFESMILLYVLH